MNQNLSCEEALRLLAAHMDRELDLKHSAEVEHHLAQCRSCYSRAEFERRLKQQLATLHKQDVSPELELRVRRLISGFGTT